MPRPRNADDVIADFEDGRLPALIHDDLKLLVERIQKLENEIENMDYEMRECRDYGEDY